MCVCVFFFALPGRPQNEWGEKWTGHTRPARIIRGINVNNIIPRGGGPCKKTVSQTTRPYNIHIITTVIVVIYVAPAEGLLLCMYMQYNCRVYRVPTLYVDDNNDNLHKLIIVRASDDFDSDIYLVGNTTIFFYNCILGPHRAK